jgi:hypothetical protein
MKLNYKKSLKFVTLLISALLIATVSAATYSYMYLNGTVTIGTQKLVWVQSSEVAGDTVTVNLNVEPGIPKSFNDTLYLKNKENAAHNMTIKVSSPADGTKFDSFWIYIYSNATGLWVFKDKLNATLLNDAYNTYTLNDPLTAYDMYKFDFVLTAKDGAAGSPTFTLEVKYE